jgi:hypothetical protein
MDIISSTFDQIDKIRMDGWLYSILIILGVATLKYQLELVEKFNIDNRIKKQKMVMRQILW